MCLENRRTQAVEVGPGLHNTLKGLVSDTDAFGLDALWS